MGSEARHALDALTLKRNITFDRLCSPELTEHVIALDHFAERGVLVVERRQIPQADEELGSRRVGISGSCHRQHSKLVLPRIELGRDVVPGPTRSPLADLGAVRALKRPTWPVAHFGVRVSTLNDKAWDDTMEGATVVEALRRQLEE
eukprot:CAMPEP_0181201848 /NCGR_PEP_ID=MMETSP1096-20121128/18521_1 /TAXON_ID=156174 ORGANISM="Chrysochromulina ericina, Strain CCMP281" /NCGR_SAMPLE_ID=MMETSP1096 /ASSEMBLY_ACC=CAM_ASM_000453 /LENGTH=146 /DNA_ID=CAMNT_0023292309 /DNA_START=322 /DNA_END=762 /DNA_ORIENTATION=+